MKRALTYITRSVCTRAGAAACLDVNAPRAKILQMYEVFSNRVPFGGYCGWNAGDVAFGNARNGAAGGLGVAE